MYNRIFRWFHNVNYDTYHPNYVDWTYLNTFRVISVLLWYHWTHFNTLCARNESDVVHMFNWVAQKMLKRRGHDDVIKWKHFPRYWPFVRGIHPGEFPAQRPVTRSCDVFFDLRLNKRLNKQSWGWWFETLSRPSWRHRTGECRFRKDAYASSY